MFSMLKVMIKILINNLVSCIFNMEEMCWCFAGSQFLGPSVEATWKFLSSHVIPEGGWAGLRCGGTRLVDRFTHRSVLK